MRERAGKRTMLSPWVPSSAWQPGIQTPIFFRSRITGYGAHGAEWSGNMMCSVSRLELGFSSYSGWTTREGNGTPPQYSCLQNPMDRGAWWAAVHGVAKSRNNWATSPSLFTFMHWRRKWQPTPVFLPGESQGLGSLVGCPLWGRTESDMTEAT